MRTIECEQRSPEWFSLRAGCITASNAHRLLTKPKCEDLAREIVGNIWGGEQELYVNSAMQWGIDNEAEAISWYWLRTKADVTHVGFCLHDEHERWGASPDGLVDDTGLVEVKCPSTKNHLLHIDKGAQNQYIAQMQWQMIVTGRKWCDFVSYDPRVPGQMSLYVKRYEFNESMAEDMIDGANWVEGYIKMMLKEHK